MFGSLAEVKKKLFPDSGLKRSLSFIDEVGAHFPRLFETSHSHCWQEHVAMPHHLFENKEKKHSLLFLQILIQVKPRVFRDSCTQIKLEVENDSHQSAEQVGQRRALDHESEPD